MIFRIFSVCALQLSGPILFAPPDASAIPSREQKLILQDLARILQKKINLARSCKMELILQDLARKS